jgi:hypothetical protein
MHPRGHALAHQQRQVANIVAGVDGWLQEIASEGFVALSKLGREDAGEDGV